MCSWIKREMWVSEADVRLKCPVGRCVKVGQWRCPNGQFTVSGCLWVITLWRQLYPLSVHIQCGALQSQANGHQSPHCVPLWEPLHARRGAIGGDFYTLTSDKCGVYHWAVSRRPCKRHTPTVQESCHLILSPEQGWPGLALCRMDIYISPTLVVMATLISQGAGTYLMYMILFLDSITWGINENFK